MFDWYILSIRANNKCHRRDENGDIETKHEGRQQHTRVAAQEFFITLL